jgi:predicted MFS family arabinose efflux permease
MLIIHPTVQFCSILVAAFALYLGIHRFRVLHLHQKAMFKWKRHVLLGAIALSALLTGMFGGMTLVYMYWKAFLMTGAHGKTAIVMLPLLLFGLGSGILMNRVKKKRKILPLIHGINNLIVILLALSQIRTGWWVYNTYVLGG